MRQRVGLLAGVLVFGLMLVLPAPADLGEPGWRAAAVGLLMAIWWMTEAIHISATALLPIVLFPLLGVVSVGEATAPYANPLIFLYMGGFMIALAMERWNLHRRLALSIIDRIGVQPLRIVAGFIVASAFLSMWVSNTATTMMMLPIGLSVVALARSPDDPEQGANFAVVLMLAIAYACSIGGVSTLIGTPTNAVLAGFMIETYGIELSFVSWMSVALPLAIIGLVIMFVVLTRFVFPIKLKHLPGGRAFIRQELEGLGPMQRPELMVAVVFTATALLWVTRPLLAGFIPGISDTGIALFSALVLFVLPVDLKRGDFVLNWEWAKRLPWGVLVLFGGGLSLAGAINDTGLASWIGASLEALSNWPPLLLLLLVVALIILLTELTSNVATAAAFLPVLGAIAIAIGQNPLLLLVPATLAASCAFMLPVATPPNAIVYGSSFVTIPQMARAGAVLNILFVVLVTVLAYTLLPLVWDVQPGVMPPWAQ